MGSANSNKQAVMSFIKELKRRNVIRVAIAYAVAAWLLIEFSATTFPMLRLPEWTATFVTVLVIIGFPLALIFAWAYELTPEGLKREKDVDRSESITQITGRKLDFMIITVLVLALIYFAYDEFVIEPAQEAALASAGTQAEEVSETGTPKMSIAVLPFVNMSDDPGNEYFSDGISEELLNMLAQFPGLRVAARTSSFQFKGMNPDIAEIADTLNVAHILEGSVRKSGTKLRITAQLIKADDGFHLWSHSYDRELDDIFAVQDEIATAIIEALKVKLALDIAVGEAAQPAVIKVANTDAYEAYLRGRQLIHRRGRERLEDALRHLERSLRLDNNFAPAHAQLAIATSLLLDSSGTYGELSLEEVRRKAIPHFERALELEPNLAEAHGGLGLLAMNSGDLTSAVEYDRRALELNPSYSDALNWLYIALGSLGRYEEAEATLKQLLVTDPMTIVGRSNYAFWLGGRGRVEEGHEIADQLLAQSLRAGYMRHAGLSLFSEAKFAEGLSWALKAHVEDPSDIFSNSYAVRGFILISEYDEARRINDSLTFWADVAEARFDEAIQTTQRKMLLDPENEAVIGNAAYVLYVAGRIDEALPLYERLLDFRPEGRPIGESPFQNVATMQLALARRKAGDEDGAQAAARIAKQDHAALGAAGAKNQWQYRTEAMFAAFEHDPDHVIAALKSAMQYGLRDPQFFGDLIFEDLWDEPQFVALQQELDTILAAEHDQVLQLICFNNPVPGDWQPLPETCEGVEEQLVL
jgi:TolB-like protein/Flp pilus assembly protein TadD